ncbi:MAG: hypothetical protein JXB18_06585 [Sedimentisphaerales bacterium]|nr:hypothetical protein [Sedimentisphaerales bacterium]
MEIKKNNTGEKHSCCGLAALIFFSMLLLSYVDYIVLEKIYHPMAAKYNINWDAEFNAVIFGKQTPILRWQLAFMPLGVMLFILLGIAAKSFRLAFSGIVLFATGWEDILYYLIQGKWLPEELGWLDYSPLMGLTRHITATEHVTSTGIMISSTFGLLIAGIILFGNEFRKKLEKAS